MGSKILPLLNLSFWIRDFAGVSICYCQQIFFELLRRRNSWSSFKKLVLPSASLCLGSQNQNGGCRVLTCSSSLTHATGLVYTSRTVKPGETIHRSALHPVIFPTRRHRAVVQIGEKSNWPVVINLFITLVQVWKRNKKLRTSKLVIDQ